MIYILSLFGVSVFAISGALSAGRKQLDLVGVTVISFITALGGGTLRDLLLNRTIFWITDTSYIWVILFSVVLTITAVRFFAPRDKLLLMADALGLALSGIIHQEQRGNKIPSLSR